MDVLKSLAEDKSWRVRFMVAEKIVSLQSAIGSELTQRDLITAFTVCHILKYTSIIF